MRGAALVAALMLASGLLAKGASIVLTPIGLVDPVLISGLARELQADLKIPVQVKDLFIDAGSSVRDDRMRWLEGLKASLKRDPERLADFKQLARKQGLQGAAMWKDENFYPLLEQAMQQDDPDDAEGLREEHALHIGAERQWDSERLLKALEKAGKKDSRPGRVLVGVTALDIGSDKTNYQYGVARPGVALISYRRFKGDMNREKADRLRLLERLKKQALLSVGEALGIPLCKDLSCPRAFANCTPDHDKKGAALCQICRLRFNSAVAQ